MGAGQIGGIATLLDIDFNNAAGFMGQRAEAMEGQYIVYYFSQAMMFCVGVLIEAHIVLTPAMCIEGERNKFEVYGGTHSFVENSGVVRTVHHLSIHKGYNHTNRWNECLTDNLALLVLNEQYNFDKRENGSEFMLNRVRYGVKDLLFRDDKKKPVECQFFGWGSRRNGYLIPLLIHKLRMDVRLLPKEVCPVLWNKDNKYLCVEQPPCKDDVGTILECSGFARGMMVSALVDRPCGVGFIDLSLYSKFLTCGVDDSRDVISQDESMAFEFTTLPTPATPPRVVPPVMDANNGESTNGKNNNNNEKSNNNNNKNESALPAYY